MGLFGKLLGGNASANDALNSLKKAAKEAGDKLNGSGADELFGALKKAAENIGASSGEAAEKTAVNAEPASAPASAGRYDSVPAGDNQYNFNGSYKDYFSGIFRDEFPAYEVRRSDANDGRVTLFDFYKDGRRVLLVELMSERSEANKRRRDAQAAGIAYLRFYYDHDGWWNERSYVVGRVSKAIGDRD